MHLQFLKSYVSIRVDGNLAIPCKRRCNLKANRHKNMRNIRITNVINGINEIIIITSLLLHLLIGQTAATPPKGPSLLCLNPCCLLFLLLSLRLLQLLRLVCCSCLFLRLIAYTTPTRPTTNPRANTVFITSSKAISRLVDIWRQRIPFVTCSLQPLLLLMKPMLFGILASILSLST